jgi:Domain of unknown function, B. Theta Gene description (DUF3871)
MELLQTSHKNQIPPSVGEVIEEIIDDIEIEPLPSPFIEANTINASLQDINRNHIIPVFIKDNEPVISHAEFISSTLNTISEIFHGETILKPNIRLSHPIKGRIPEAKNKPAIELLEHEKTLYYERMAFVVEIPTISTLVGGNKLNLTVGGVKAYNLDNLYNKSGADQHFKFFIGFENKVCTNLSVTTDGYLANLKVKNLDMLRGSMMSLLKDFNAVKLADQLQSFSRYELTEQQFATLIGRCRMYRYLPENLKHEIQELMFGESQINSVCHDYYSDNSFCSNPDGSINLWKLYNLFTGANKSSYIDSFLDRSVNAFQLATELQSALEHKSDCWYLN